MARGVARNLRRWVDALQRSLFDDVAPRADPAEVAAMPPAVADAGRPARGARSIVLDGQRIAYALVRTRRRTIGFSIDGEGLEVRAPNGLTLRGIEAALQAKSGWILVKLAEQRERRARLEAARIVWEDGARLRFLGAPIVLRLDREHGLAADEVVLDEAASDPAVSHAAACDAAGEGASCDAGTPRVLHVGLPHDASPERIRDAVQSWLQREARRVFAARAAHFSALLDVRVRRLSLSSASTRWGSASASGAVRLHWRLIHFSLATIDYVVAHELAHLREMNHGQRFWAVVRSVVPDYERERRRLRDERIPAG